MSRYSAIIAHSFGGPSDVALGELESKPFARHQFRIKVYCAGVNAANRMAVSGTHQRTPQPPFRYVRGRSRRFRRNPCRR